MSSSGTLPPRRWYRAGIANLLKSGLVVVVAGRVLILAVVLGGVAGARFIQRSASRLLHRTRSG